MQQFSRPEFQPRFDFNVRQIINQCGAFPRRRQARLLMVVLPPSIPSAFAVIRVTFRSLMAVMIKEPRLMSAVTIGKYPHGETSSSLSGFWLPHY